MHLSHWAFLLATALFHGTCRGEDFTPKVFRKETSNVFDVQEFDDSTTLLMVDNKKLSVSSNNGENWELAENIDKAIGACQIDPFHSHDRAFALPLNETGFYMTNNQGKSWEYVHIGGLQEDFNYASCDVQSHPDNRDYLLVACETCKLAQYNDPSSQKDVSYQYCTNLKLASKDSGKSFNLIEPPTTFVEDDPRFSSSAECYFGKSSTKSNFLQKDSTIYCLNLIREVNDEHKIEKMTSELYYTDDFGKSIQLVEEFKGKTIHNFDVLDSHIIATVKSDQFNDVSPLILWVSNDGKRFQEAFLPTTLRYFRRQSTFEDIAGRIILPVITEKESSEDNKATKQGATMLLRSDSTGLKFSSIPWGSSELEGYMLLQKSETLPGTMLGEFHSNHRAPRRVKNNKSKTKITTDNGATWHNLKVVDPDNKDIYSCDIEDFENCSLHGYFSWKSVDVPTAGIMMLIGSVGVGERVNLDELMTFISIDGGHTWRMVFEYPTQFDYGDLGNIIVVMPFNPEEDNDPLSEFYYSLDHGRTWIEYQLEKSVFPIELESTTPDGSGLNFIINGFSSESKNSDKIINYIYAIDFSEAYGGTSCQSQDLEIWELADGKCVNGAKYSVQRRKQDSSCLVRKVFEDLQVKKEPCEQCTTDDYECSFEFSKNSDGKCTVDYELLALSGSCSKSRKGLVKLSPMKKINGNSCRREMSVEPVEATCRDLSDPNDNRGKIRVTENSFSSPLAFYQYFDTVEDESIIIATERNGVFISHDSGQTIRRFDADDNIIEVIFNPFFNSSAYFFGASGSLYVTRDRGNSFYVTDLPEARQLGFPLEFHAKDENTFIYYGGKDCDSMFDANCHAVAYITHDGGETFNKLLDNAIHCEFAGSTFKYPVHEDLIVCQVKERYSQKRSLFSSADFFQNDKKVLFDSIIGYMSTGDFLVVAIPYADMELRAYVTVDGDEFAEAKFPHDALSEKQESFTVLGSQTGAIFLHVSTSDNRRAEFGVLMKSNSNGTSFVALENAVNRNRFGMVDFEKVEGLEGIILVNIVSNPERASDGSEEKRLKSKITFNDGSDWDFINPPSKDSEGKEYSCSKQSLDKCSLHLHSYTEREDTRDTFSSGSAIGMLIGVGNVGEYLLPEDECSTFLSRDGGITWEEIKKLPVQWEYGDHGGVIILVQKNAATDTVTYSVDSGKTWEDYKFTDEKTVVKDVVTVPRDSALRFLLVAESSSISGDSTKTFSIDFSGRFERQCLFNPQDPDHDDFDYFTLGNSDSQCLFGHEAEYLKKNREDCYVGNVPLTEFFKIRKNCSCSRQDFECDYNYYKSSDGTCKLVKGLNPSDPSDICRKDSNIVEYFKPSGYRKIPLSTCEGGLKLDEVSDPFPCPGKEREFNEKHGIHGRSFLLIFLIPFVIFVLIAWFVYDRGIRRNGGFSRFGEIRLNDDELIENNGTDRVVNQIVKSGLFAFSGLFAGYQLMKRSIGNTISKIGNRMRGRRGPSYSSLVHDQFLDEADDLLAGHDEDANDLGDFLDNERNFEIEEDNLSVPDQIQSQSTNETRNANSDN